MSKEFPVIFTAMTDYHTTREFTKVHPAGNPSASVIMSVYNGELYLREAVESILNQTFADFEFIIIDDGSTDATHSILESYQDTRIVRLHNSERAGMGAAYNRAFEIARGEFIAMQDADDLSLPERLMTEATYLRRHPDVGVVGTAFYRSNARGEILERICPNDNDTAIRWHMLFITPLLHGSLMFRSQIVKDGGLRYEAAPPVEDYEFLTKLLKQTRAAGLQEPFYIYRSHGGNTTEQLSGQLMDAVRNVSACQIKALLPHYDLSAAEVKALHEIVAPANLSELHFALCIVMLQMFENFMSQPGIDSSVAQRLRREWIRRVVRSIRIEQWREGWNSAFFRLIVKSDPMAVGLVVLPELVGRLLRRGGLRRSRKTGRRGVA